MNLTRILELRKLIAHCTNILQTKDKYKKINCKRQLENILDKMSAKANSGFWGMTSCDKEYAEYLTQIIKAVKNTENGINILKDLEAKIFALPMPKLKIVFFAQEYTVWPSMKTVYEACKADERYITQLVHVTYNNTDKENLTDEIKPYENAGYEIIRDFNYDVALESPDIAVLTKPYDLVIEGLCVTNLDKAIPRLVLIPYAIQVGDDDICKLYHFRLPLCVCAWKAIAYSNAHYERGCNVGYRNGENLIKIAFPRLESDFAKYKNKNIENEILKKANGRKIVFWNTHFTLEEEIGEGTFLSNYKVILKKFEENSKTLFLLWRPHPHFFMHLLNALGKEKYDELFLKIEKCENVYLDKSESYVTSFSLAEAMISDAASLAIEFLATQKPLLYTLKQNGARFYDRKLENDVYVMTTEDDLNFFVDEVVIKEKDTMYEQRITNINEHIIISNGEYSTGKRLCDHFYAELKKECEADYYE